MPQPPESPERPDGSSDVEVVETSSLADLTPPKEVETLVLRQMAASSRLVPNTGQVILAVPTDRLRLHLRDLRDRLEARTSWHAPAGILASLIAALVASDFRDRWWIPAATWNAMFLVAAAICAGWLIVALIQAVRSRRGGDDVERVVASLKTGSDEPTAAPLAEG